MSANYNILLESEKELKKLTIEYLEYVKHIHAKLWYIIFEKVDRKKDDLISTELNDSMYRRLDHAEGMNSNLVDECVWVISKDNPRANHLRFIISVIQSAKDLERAGNYALTISKTITRRKILYKNILLLKPLIERYLKIFDEYALLYNSSNKEKIENVENIWEEFSEFEHSFTKKIRKSFRSEENEFDYFPISQVIKAIESTIERVKGIFNSSKYVNQKTMELDLRDLK